MVRRDESAVCGGRCELIVEEPCGERYGEGLARFGVVACDLGEAVGRGRDGVVHRVGEGSRVVRRMG